MIIVILKHGHLLNEINKTNINLILENKNQDIITDYRAINLGNVSYKFISKLLANRHLIVLLKITSPFQSAFVPNGNILDNILIAMKC